MAIRWTAYVERTLAVVLVLIFLPTISSAAIVRVNLSVEEIIDDYTGLQVGDNLGYIEYDNTGLVPWQEATPGSGLVSWTPFTAFSFNFDGVAYGLEDIEGDLVFFDDDYLYADPFAMWNFSVSSGLNAQVLSTSPYSQLFEGIDATSTNYFQIKIQSAYVPLPAAAWLFASGLGLLGWLRRKAPLRTQSLSPALTGDR